MNIKQLSGIAGLILVIILIGCTRQADRGSEIGHLMSQSLDSTEKLLVVGDSFDLTLKMDSRPERLDENIIVMSIFNKLRSRYESPMDADVLNFEDYFEIISISEGWEMEKVERDLNYEIVLVMGEAYPGIYENAWVLINSNQANQSKELTVTLKAKQKGGFGLRMAQIPASTAYSNLCVGDTLQEAQEYCKEKIPTSTRESAIETNE